MRMHAAPAAANLGINVGNMQPATMILALACLQTASCCTHDVVRSQYLCQQHKAHPGLKGQHVAIAIPLSKEVPDIQMVICYKQTSVTANALYIHMMVLSGPEDRR